MPAARPSSAVARKRRATVPALRATCRALEDALRPMCEAAELAAVRPGGAENPDRGLDGHVEWYASLRGLAGRPIGGEAESGVDAALSDAVIESARANTPVAVVTADGETRYVYAKSYHALRWLDGLDAQLAYGLAQMAEYPDSFAVHAVGALLESLQVRLWAWIVTHPPAGLPFAEHAKEPDPPAWTQNLTADDLIGLWRAHYQVNGRDLQIIGALFPPPTAGAAGRFTLGSFLGGLAHEWRLRVGRVMRRWPLRELFAQAVDAARSAKAARDDAERAAKERP